MGSNAAHMRLLGKNWLFKLKNMRSLFLELSHTPLNRNRSDMLKDPYTKHTGIWDMANFQGLKLCDFFINPYDGLFMVYICSKACLKYPSYSHELGNRVPQKLVGELLEIKYSWSQFSKKSPWLV